MSDHFQELLSQAKNNDAEAQFQLAEAYRTGDGIPASPAEALRWYKAAAQQGLADAQNNLGAMYLSGQGSPKDLAEAIRWYQKAAEQGQIHAQFNLGMLYLNGIGVEASTEEAINWLHAAASQGDLEALFQLGKLFMLGEGDEKNLVAATELLTAAAIEGHLDALQLLTQHQEEIEEAALEGSIITALCMVKKYDHALGTEADAAQAYAWLQWARLHGKHDEDEDELEYWEGYINSVTSEEDIERGNKMLNEMRGRADELM